MPRMVAPPPSGEFHISLTRPFSGTPESSVEILGEPNRPAVVRRTNYTSGTKTNEKAGDVPKDDVEELMALVSAVRGFPSHGTKDVYGEDARLDLTTFDIQWSNLEEGGAEGGGEVEGEQREEFARVVQSIEALAREFAKRDAAV